MARAEFSPSLLGGSFERRYRADRPDIEGLLPWKTLDARAYAEPLVDEARRFWTQCAFQEHRSAATCAATVEALIVAGAPVDLVAVASRFLVDEMAHVELCARVAAQLGGGAPLLHDTEHLFPRPSLALSPLLRAASLVVHFFCVGEAFSLPMQRHTQAAQRHPLIRAVIRSISRDEAAHARFGWVFLDWAAPALASDERARHHLAAVAAAAIATLERSFPSPTPPTTPTPLGWLPPTQFLTHAHHSLDTAVRQPLTARGLL